MMTDKLKDGLHNLYTKMGSSIDPNASNAVAPICEQDYYTWFANGGLSTKLATLKARKMGSGLSVTVGARKQNKTAEKEVAALQDWFNAEFRRLKINQLFVEAEIQCNIDRAAPIAIALDQPLLIGYPIDYKPYASVAGLRILNPTFVYPNQVDGLGAVDHNHVSSYTIHQGGSTSIHASRLIPFQGEKCLASETQLSSHERYWGRPLIGKKLIESTLRYDAAIAALGIVLHKKNFLAMAIKGFEEGMDGDNESTESYANNLTIRVNLLQRISNLLGVAMHDVEDRIETIDRNMSGMSDALESIKEEILTNCNYPASILFGVSKSGGLSSSSQQDKKNLDSSAAEDFEYRWVPHLEQIVKVLAGCDSCPVKNHPLELITVSRKSSYLPEPKEEAETQKMITEADKIRVDTGAMTADEMRSRMSGHTFELNIPLEGKATKIEVAKPEPVVL